MLIRVHLINAVIHGIEEVLQVIKRNVGGGTAS
jgi:hypothetical protein